MSKYLFKISTKLKDEIKDPQGEVVEKISSRLQISDNLKIKVGKFYEIIIEANNKEQAITKINRLAAEILSNPIVETYCIETIEVQ